MAQKTVLAVEHDWRMRRLIQVNLRAYGLEVRGAVNGRHALHLLAEDAPDLILVDEDLPDMDVAHLLDRMRVQLGEGVPIIILLSEPPSRDAEKNGHRIYYVLKPFAAPALLRQVCEALAESDGGSDYVGALG